MTKHHVMLLNIPRKLHPPIKRAVLHGLAKIERLVDVSKPMEVALYYDVYELKNSLVDKHFLTDGRILSENTIVISFNVRIRKGQLAKRMAMLEGTVVHEYIHTLRPRHFVHTLLDKIVEEGVACWIQTRVVGLPDYIDTRHTRIEDLEGWWKAWHRRYLLKPMEKTESLLNDITFYHALYQLGYYIVDGYLKTHPELSTKDIIAISSSKLYPFAKKLFSSKKFRERVWA